MKIFLAYCVFVSQASEAAEAEQVNTPVDPDGQVQLFNEVQSSATQIEVKTKIIRSQMHCSLHITNNLNVSKINQNAVYTCEVPE